MGLWNTDLSTQRGARRAAELGSLGCFVLAGLTIVDMLRMREAIAREPSEGLIGVVLGLLLAVICIAAGLRLRRGKGAYLGVVVVLLPLLVIAVSLLTMTKLPIILIMVPLLVIVVHGIRGAMALRAAGPREEEDGTAFE